MNLKRASFRLCVRAMERMMRLLPMGRHVNLSLSDMKGRGLDIITVAYNNDELIAIQHSFLKRFVKDDFCHIVADNSSDRKCSDRLYEYCRKEGIAYVRLPLNLLGRIGGSYSHSGAVNYVYHRIVSRRSPSAFGIVDHDLFPVRDVRVMDYLDGQPFYGPLRRRGTEGCWYLSAIMSFYDMQWVRSHGGIDYMPVTPYNEYMDSGGGNWYRLYSKVDADSCRFPDEEIVPLRDGGDRHGDSLEYFDGRRWLHTINGSCWKRVADGKDSMVRTLLEDILKK